MAPPMAKATVSASYAPWVKAGGVSQAMRSCGRRTVSVTVARRCEVMAGVVAVTGATAGPCGMGPKYLVSRSFSFFGSKSPAMAIVALLGV